VNGVGRVKGFDELDDAVGDTGTVRRLEKRYLNVEDEDTVGAVKEYAKSVLKTMLDRHQNPRTLLDRLKNRVGYRKVLIAKYGILVLAARRRMDKENPRSLISKLEEKIRHYVGEAVKRLNLPWEKVYHPWMTVLSYPTPAVGDCHPWIVRFKDTLGAWVVESARRVRAFIDVQRRLIMRRVSEAFKGLELKEFEHLLEKLQRIHFWSEKDEWEEDEDLALTNQVIDVFCPHLEEHKTLREIAQCPGVKSYLTPGKMMKMRLAAYVLIDDYLGSGRRLREISSPTSRGHVGKRKLKT
jgi:hypothetical protein